MNQNRIYIVLTLILISLSLGGLIYFYRPSSTTPPTLLEEIVAIPTTVLEESQTPLIESVADQPLPTDQPSPSEPVISPPEPTELVEATPTPTISTLTSLQFGFEVPYASSRKLYESPQNGGTRYTLYSPSGNITVHAGTRWSWLHPGREFTSEFMVSSRPTFVYKISSQTIVDFEVGDTKITVQCVHGGREAAISECQKFLSDFRLTSGS